ncbi:hypothetical protein F2P79_021599 [Pimephales promelas]|nr:hypothetical protein F2P79_021599 [Pimephales promelas]
MDGLGIEEREGERTATHCAGTPGTGRHTQDTLTHSHADTNAHISACFCPPLHRPELASQRAALHSQTYNPSQALFPDRRNPTQKDRGLADEWLWKELNFRDFIVVNQVHLPVYYAISLLELTKKGKGLCLRSSR